MNTKSRILETGDNQVSYLYRLHVSNKKSGRGWALGIDIVKYKSQIDYITAHSLGTVIKCVNYLSGTNGVPDREGMGYGNYIILRHSDKLCTVYAWNAYVSHLYLLTRFSNTTKRHKKQYCVSHLYLLTSFSNWLFLFGMDY